MERANAPPSVPPRGAAARVAPSLVPGWFRAGFRLGGAIMPGPTAKLAQRLFFTPQRLPVRPEQRAILERGERFELTGTEGETVVGRAWGNGPAVLLVHGWSGHSGQMTPFVDPLVAAGLKPVAFDMPGHGASSGKRSSVIHFQRALVQVAARFAPVKAVIAHSVGAAATTYAFTRGLGAERAVYFATPARHEALWARFRAALAITDGVWERLVRDTEAWLGVRMLDTTPADLAGKMTIPLLAFHDPEDPEIPFAEGEELVRLWPGATLVQVANAGHRRILADAECVARAVAFVRG